MSQNLSRDRRHACQLAYYPPYHSKYNPVDRLWSALENHWQGEILDSINKALGLARSMTYRGIKPTVRKVTKFYRKGVTMAKKAMLGIESRLERTTWPGALVHQNSPAALNGIVIFFRGPNFKLAPELLWYRLLVNSLK
ncbi:MAG: hypothetical protein KZQ66_17075 [Candidatus Thiodiazotropha sp. (ex Lucinoma aequizonata)]|nr:hypothetical protein [Candidatus Thiodiazotropha sp. (ex Lucinoma aequizonata)]MCU7887511.1 hypothetical protein [Candidatus Thiodiazotropha sp. (ex Lucinoma aequizonata)]MCU7896511.1 hypothetical protein [Candidatus Thiodiazotropha sp. (ex Lucinoma aequizonata)]MCU7897801.1 hypothetical protein [Candidatus Thiodiazotropha sp. (ex Lucinoma aequizonata)]MCU7903486.1 hypothetical protein [Candidatus Thiodiazotropha sp. (ex Lucinoma aequizonata)]